MPSATSQKTLESPHHRRRLSTLPPCLHCHHRGRLQLLKLRPSSEPKLQMFNLCRRCCQTLTHSVSLLQQMRQPNTTVCPGTSWRKMERSQAHLYLERPKQCQSIDMAAGIDAQHQSPHQWTAGSCAQNKLSDEANIVWLCCNTGLMCRRRVLGCLRH